MKFLLLTLAVFSSITTAHAQSLDRYDGDFRRDHLVQGALTAAGELVVAGALVASYNPKVAVAFWKKYFPKETAKITDAIAERNKVLKELGALKKSPTASTAETQKLIKETEGFAKEWKAEIKRLSKELEIARTAKLKSIGFFGTGRVIAGTVKVFSWARKGIIVYALFNGVTRTVVLLTDKPGSDLSDPQLDNLSPEELQQLMP